MDDNDILKFNKVIYLLNNTREWVFKEIFYKECYLTAIP